MINHLDVWYIDTHTKSFCRNHHLAMIVLECLISKLLLISFHSSMEGDNHSFFYLIALILQSVDVSCVWRIHDSFHVQVMDALDDIDGFSFLILVIATCRIVIMGINDKLNIVTAYIAYKLMRVMHVQAVDTVKDHIVHTTIHSCCGQGYQREHIIIILAHLVDMITQEPIIHTEISSPCGDKVCFIDNEQA